MLRLLLITGLVVVVTPMLAQAPSSTADTDETVEFDQLMNQHLDTFAELESWVLAESTLADIARAINVEDIVTPVEDFLQTTLNSLSETYRNVSENDLGVTLKRTQDNQVMVTTIQPEGRFHVSDLKPNDVITVVNGELEINKIDDPVQTIQHYLLPYAKVVKGFPPLVLNVNRGGKSVDVKISNEDEALQSFTLENVKARAPTLNLVKNQHGTFALHYELPPSVFLLEVEEEMGQYFDVEFGVLVLQAPKDRGFKAGDILVEIEENSIRSIDHVTKALKRSDDDPITIIVKRKGRSMELEMERSSVIFRNAEEQMSH